MERVEIPFNYNMMKSFMQSLLGGAIILLVVLIDYCITYSGVDFNRAIFITICGAIIFLGYYGAKCREIIVKKKPCIILDREKITSCGLIRKYSISIECFKGYKFVQLDGRDFVNIYPKDYRRFKKEIGFHIITRLMFRNIKSRGFEGLMIGFMTIAANYDEAIRFLDKIFKEK